MEAEVVAARANLAGIKKYKIVFLGNQSVGKTSIIHRYMNNTFTQDYAVYLLFTS